MNVYFIQCNGKNGPIKIGVTSQLKERLETLQTGNPYELRLITSIKLRNMEEAFSLEKKLHKKFRRFLIRGEWFSSKIRISDVWEIQERKKNSRALKKIINNEYRGGFQSVIEARSASQLDDDHLNNLRGIHI